MDKALVSEEVPVVAEVLESHLLETQGKDLALMIRKEASKDCRSTLLAPGMGPLSLERRSRVPLEVRSKEQRL